MNSDAGTEDFFWRESTQEEEKRALEEILHKNKEDRQRFLDGLRKREQRRKWKRG